MKSRLKKDQTQNGKISGILSKEKNYAAFMGELEAGTCKGWAQNRKRAFFEGKNLLQKNLGGSVMMRLSEGGMEGSSPDTTRAIKFFP